MLQCVSPSRICASFYHSQTGAKTKRQNHHLWTSNMPSDITPSNKPSRLLNEEENNQVFSLLGPKCVTVETAVTHLYAHDNSGWTSQGIGVLCLVIDAEQRSYFLRFYSLERMEQVIEQQLYPEMAPRLVKDLQLRISINGFLLCFSFAEQPAGQAEARDMVAALNARLDKLTASAAAAPPGKSPTVHSAVSLTGPAKVLERKRSSSEKTKIDRLREMEVQGVGALDTAQLPPRQPSPSELPSAAQPAVKQSTSVDEQTPPPSNESLADQLRNFRKENLKPVSERKLAEPLEKDIMADIRNFRPENLKSASERKLAEPKEKDMMADIRNFRPENLKPASERKLAEPKEKDMMADIRNFRPENLKPVKQAGGTNKQLAASAPFAAEVNERINKLRTAVNGSESDRDEEESDDAEWD